MFDAVYSHRRLLWAGLAILLALALLGATKLTVSSDNRIFYGPENPYFVDYLEFESEFGSNDNIVFAVQNTKGISEAPTPQAIRWLASEIPRLPYVVRVDSLANYPNPISHESEISVETILDTSCPGASACDRALTSKLEEPHLVGRLVNEPQTVTGVVATIRIDRGAVGEIERLHNEAKALLQEFREHFPSLSIYYTGGVPMMAAFAEETARDLGLLLPIALIAISVLLGLVLGSTWMASAIVLMGLASIVVTLGTAGWLGHVLNNATSIVPLVVFTLVVASSMHIAVHYSRNLPPNATKAAATAQAKASLSSSVTPILLSAVTSAVSLSSLVFVDSPPIRQLGLLSALGVLVGCLLTIAILPVTLSFIHKISDNRLSTWIQIVINGLARDLEAGKSRTLIAAFLFGAAFLGLTQLRVNEDFVRFFDESVEFRQQTDAVSKLLTGPNHIEVVLTNPTGSVFSPEFLEHTSAITEWLRKHKLVSNAHSLSDVLGEVSQAFSGKPLEGSVTEDELAQLFLVYELSLQQGQSNTDLVDASQQATRVSVLLKDSTSTQIQALEKLIYDWDRQSGKPFELVVTGENIPVAHLSLMNIRAMTVGIFLSLAFTALIVAVAFKSAKLGLVALISTVLPVLAGFGVWGWVSGDIGLAVIALTIGVVVDDSAHFIYRFLDGRNRLDLEPWQAAAYACHRAGAAIVGTSVVMGLGLLLLVASSFEVNSSFGAVACLIIVSALIFDLAILPRLTVWTARFGSPQWEKRA